MEQVICINDSWDEPNHRVNCLPIKGSIYTIKQRMEGMKGKKNHLGKEIVTDFLAFEEIYFPKVNPKDCYPFWREDWFRPVKKTDISIFTQILKNINCTKSEKRNEQSK